MHSDLKPANVLIGDDGTPLLVDFNLSGDAAAPDRETLLVGGTLAYMSPEHLQATLEGGQASAASDIYSLGVIFFELLTGRRPFPSRDGSFDDNALTIIVDRRARCPDGASPESEHQPGRWIDRREVPGTKSERLLRPRQRVGGGFASASSRPAAPICGRAFAARDVAANGCDAMRGVCGLP